MLVKIKEKLVEFLNEQLGKDLTEEDRDIFLEETFIVMRQGPTAVIFDSDGKDLTYVDIDIWTLKDYQELFFGMNLVNENEDING